MGCAGCNVSSLQVASAVALAKEWGYADKNCTNDGSFTVQGKHWPAPYHFVDAGLARFLIGIVGGASLLDVGAGSGQYGSWFFEQRQKQAGAVPAWRGVDGAANVEEFTRTRGPPGSLVSHANICDPRLVLPSATWLMSLEVGEHLPSACLATYIRLLSRTARDGLVLSWARVGQGGHCHISTRSEGWVRDALGRTGWAADEALTARARAAASLGFLKRNVLVFRPDHRTHGARRRL